MARCRSCQAEVVWAIMESSGKRHPFDADSTTGRWMLYMKDDTLYASHLTASDVDGMDGSHKLYVSHYATCPDAERWRKGRE